MDISWNSCGLFFHISKPLPMNFGFHNALCTTCCSSWAQTFLLHQTQIFSSVAYRKMIDVMTAKIGSIKFHFKINVQTSELICHAVCLFKQASLFYICFVFSVVFPQVWEMQIHLWFDERLCQVTCKNLGAANALSCLSEIPSQYEDRVLKTDIKRHGLCSNP